MQSSVRLLSTVKYVLPRFTQILKKKGFKGNQWEANIFGVPENKPKCSICLPADRQLLFVSEKSEHTHIVAPLH